MSQLYQIIRRTRITEKGALLNELNDEVVFEVDSKANKTEIKRAVETLLDVEVDSVRTMNCRGKLRRKRRADQGRTANWKKAIVRLKAGSKSLDIY